MRPAVAAMLVVVVAAGCGSAATLSQKDVQRAVLQPADLPGWTRFENDPGTNADVGALGSSDRIGAWISRFRNGKGIVVSRVDVYRSKGAAHTIYARLVGEIGSSARAIATPSLGDERAGYAVSSTVKLESLFWRRANAIGSIVVQGGVANAGKLATRQDSRIGDAAG
jgi:hypothetical protein